ncbi:MAG: ATP-binding protein [Oligoflexia bacterium]|nr:ATP-binding protein [Oligoflexia bacterium]
MTTGVLVHSEGTEIIIFALDLSEMKKLEMQFRQSQKMEAMGRFAGGIAHDFNNMLGVILLHAEQALVSTKDKSLINKLQSIKETSHRAARLTRQILAFSRKQAFEINDIDFNIIAHDMQKMLMRVVSEDIKLTTQLCTTPAIIRADQSQIEQTILNLIVNARDAIFHGGKINLQVSNTDLTDAQISERALQLKPGNFFTLTVTDDGCGIPKEILSHVFEPFFTTKNKGSGTGLGLSTVFGIVRQTGGDISVESSVNNGTSFNIYFPASQTRDFKTHESKGSSLPYLINNQNILLVEDEEQLRIVTAELLHMKGYNVIEAKNGKEAFELLKSTNLEIALIITDVIMPEMTGPALIQYINKHYPNTKIKVLYLSGYPEGELERYGVKQDSSYFLEKPYTTAGLLDKVGEILL